jgi:hypothetical protein
MKQLVIHTIVVLSVHNENILRGAFFSVILTSGELHV